MQQNINAIFTNRGLDLNDSLRFSGSFGPEQHFIPSFMGIVTDSNSA